METDKVKLRKQIKKSKPSFKRSQTNQFAKFKGDGWRKPKGMGNKLRRGRKGHQKSPTTGFGSPKEVRGLNNKGLEEIPVSNLSDLEKVTEKNQAVLISSTVGKRKRIEILNEAKKKSLQVSNIKDVDSAIKSYTKTKVVKEKKETPKKVEAKKEASQSTPSKSTKKEVKEE